MNNDLISRSALIKWIDDSVSQYGHTYSTDMLNMWGLFKDYLINNAPTVDITQKIQSELISEVFHSIARQYYEHNEVVPFWLSIGDIRIKEADDVVQGNSNI